MKWLLLLLFLIACSTTIPMRPIDMSNFKMDSNECIQQSRTFYISPSFLAPMGKKLAQKKADNLYIKCMESKGYVMKGVENESDKGYVFR